MFTFTESFSGFSVDNLSKAKEFYTSVLGVEVVDEQGIGLTLKLPGNSVFVYSKPNHMPATFTVLNLKVENIDEAVDALKEKGAAFEVYDGMHQDEKGIMRGKSVNQGPDIAWFKDPAGNIFSVIEE